MLSIQIHMASQPPTGMSNNPPGKSKKLATIHLKTETLQYTRPQSSDWEGNSAEI